MRGIIKQKGSKNIAYVDESGFEPYTYRDSAWSKRGSKSYGERVGRREKRTNLIAAKRGKELIATVLYNTSTTALWFNKWLKECLFKELSPNSTIIMDNACFHKKEDVYRITKNYGHDVLFLPPYSPDFNPIEKVFAILKKRRAMAPIDATIDQIVREYGSFLE